jgi:CelD/BcsL family acetyltransferase involved in cellulose biosynthesis
MSSAVRTAVKTIDDSVADLELPCRPTLTGCAAVRAERCELVTEFQRLEELAPEWKRLWESDPRAEIFQTLEWARAWWQSYGKQVRLCTPVVFAGDQVVGILPLVEQDRVIRLLGTPEADYADIICDEQRSAEVMALALKALLEAVPGWNECAFHHLSKHSRLVRHYPELPREIRSRVHCLPAGPLQTIILRNQREEILKALLGKQHTRRLQNKLRKAGELRFRHLDAAEAEAYLPGFFRHHVRRHAAIGRQSSFASADFCRFIGNIIQELAPSQRVRFGVLELNRQPLAWALGFEVNGKFLLYQHTFDLDVAHYTPGEVLLWNVLDYAREHISREFDFGRGDESYKDRFTNYSRETYSLFLDRRSLKGRLRGVKRGFEAWLLPALQKAKQTIKSRRAILRAYRSARMWMIGTSNCLRQAKTNGAVLQCGLRITQELFGHFVLSRRSTDIFVAATSPMAMGTTPGAADREGAVRVDRARFGDLVDLSCQHPEILSLHTLEQCRTRLKDGDKVYIAGQDSQVVSVCWASGVPASDDGASKTGLGESRGVPALVAEEFWSARHRDLSGVYRLLLSNLAAEAAKGKADLLVHCGSHQPGLRQELLRQGFVRKFHSTRYRIFSRYQHEAVSQYAEAVSLSSQAA